MPLPNVANGTAQQCIASNRQTGKRCLNPAAFGMATCRYHGARKRTSVRQGANHPQYRHGMETLDAKRQRREGLERVRLYEATLVKCGLLQD
jgi:glucose-6-phosphate dehydrogenase assembly protein OpcA